MMRLLLPLLAALSCGFVSLPIEQAANTSRTDTQAADGKGGWLDLGSNDLSILPAGEARYAGVRFVVPPSGDETAKNSIVLGRAGAATATLNVANPASEKCLYLLHAVAHAPTPESHTAIGTIILRYDDGATDTCNIRVGRDVSEWTCGRSFANAARAWTEYNHNTQVSLYASRFALADKKKLTSVTFSANETCPWMILGASLAGEKRLTPIKSCVEPSGTFRSPKPPAGLVRFPAGQKPKNIILVIGDGMGQGAARLASYYKYGREDALYFQQLPIAGLCTTFSASAPVTDSAASATAFATGTKTSNGILGLQVDEKHDRKNPVMLTSVAARAHAQGRGVAIMTSDALYQATPSAFFAHSLSRGDSALICQQASECGYEVLIGRDSTEAFFRPEAQGGKRKDARDLVAEMQKNGYAFVHTPEEMAATPRGAKILGAFTTLGEQDHIGEESIATAMKQALTRVGDNPKGFFMMAECGMTDHACHANDASKTVKAVSMVEFMAQIAVDFAQTRNDTLVIVTADHDTGHPIVLRSCGDEGRISIQWTDTSHTKYAVPIYAYGPGAEHFEGIIDNTDIAKNVARLLKLDGCAH